MRRLAALLLGFVALMLTSGCGGGARYRVVEAGPAYPSIPAKVVVTDFKDERSYDKRLASTAKAAPFTFVKSWYISRPEEAFGGVEVFPALFARNLAANLAEGGHFSEVVYAPPDEMPEKGTYDLLLTGTLKESTARGSAYFYGLVLPLGFKFSDVLWYMGAPKLTRRYDFAFDIQLYDAYTDKPLGRPISVSERTSSKSFTVYANEGKLEDMQTKIVAVWNDYLVAMHREQPSGDAQYWAALRTDGQQYLRQVRLEQDMIRRGSPPVFTFISPTDESTVRSDRTTIRWSLTSPNGLRSLALALNNEALDTGVRSVDLADMETAPRSVSARETPIRLQMGRNVIDARVTDHRGNTANAELAIHRLPRQLTPEKRFALVIGAGSAAAQETARSLASVLTDPLYGQFAESDVRVLTTPTFDPEALGTSIRAFVPYAKAGELALLYIAVPGDAQSGALGSGAQQMELRQFVESLRRSAATEEVVLLLDIDWNGRNDGVRVLDQLGDVPSRWAVGVSSNAIVPAETTGGRLVFGAAIEEILAGRAGRTDRVTLESMLDQATDRARRGAASPEFSGRYNPNITMAEFQ